MTFPKKNSSVSHVKIANVCEKYDNAYFTDMIYEETQKRLLVR